MSDELELLKQKIEKAKIAYYQTGRSELTDAEYDRLVERAEKLGYIDTVGTLPVDNIKTIKHEHPMLSLDKCHSADEVDRFMNHKDMVAMYKADGLTCSATYIDGILTRLETRGDGNVGNDVMFHANSFENLPKMINKSGKYVIDGECVILWSDFEKINEKLPESERYSHPRNLAAGSLNQQDPKISKQRHLKFFAWDVIEGGIYPNSLNGNLAEAEDLGFDVVEYVLVYQAGDVEELFMFLSVQDAIDYLYKSAQEKRFPIDGIVFKFNDIGYGKSLGMTSHHPRNAIAYKFKDDTYPTKLISVTWQVGKTSQITPVANFKPVDCNGVIVEKSSLHNISIIKQIGLTNGCTCYIKRSGDVIPQIDSVDYDGNGAIEIPQTCPICGAKTKVVKENQSEVLYCTNESCPGKSLGKWKAYVSKQGMDVDGLSEQTLDKFLRLGFLTTEFTSLYNLAQYKDKLYTLDGFGKKSIDNLLAAIEASKDVTLDRFICAFSIDNIGAGQSKLLAKVFKNFGAFRDACDNGFDFSQISGIGTVLNKSIHKWWANNNDQMVATAKIVRFEEDKRGKSFMNAPVGVYPLLDKVFVITGKVYNYANRDALKAEIEQLGGKVASGISKNTSYLINNDLNSTSSKNKKAHELGIPIISEEEYIAMIS